MPEDDLPDLGPYHDVERLVCENIDRGWECEIHHEGGTTTKQVQRLTAAPTIETSFNRSEGLERNPDPEYVIAFENVRGDVGMVECRFDSAQQLERDTAKKWEHGALTCKTTYPE